MEFSAALARWRWRRELFEAPISLGLTSGFGVLIAQLHFWSFWERNVNEKKEKKSFAKTLVFLPSDFQVWWPGDFLSEVFQRPRREPSLMGPEVTRPSPGRIPPLLILLVPLSYSSVTPRKVTLIENLMSHVHCFRGTAGTLKVKITLVTSSLDALCHRKSRRPRQNVVGSILVGMVSVLNATTLSELSCCFFSSRHSVHNSFPQKRNLKYLALCLQPSARRG